MRKQTIVLAAALWLVLEQRLDAHQFLAKLTAEQAAKYVSNPRDHAEFGPASNRNLSPFRLETDERLEDILYGPRYIYQDADKEVWNKLLNDDKASVYARLCASLILLPKEEKARDFLKTQLASKDLRHRYNAAHVLLRSLREEANRAWSMPLLIELVRSGALDDSGVHSSPPGNFPEGDQNDIMYEPQNDICWALGFAKEKQAVPALIAVLERQPDCGGAAFALGEIGDPRGIPILLKLLEKGTSRDAREITALGQLKAKEAIPGLLLRLKKSITPDTLGRYETDEILEALLEIGDKRVIPDIEAVLQQGYPEGVKKVAHRVLVQMKAPDKVAGLLELLAAETYEPESSDLIDALAQHRDPRVVKCFEDLARNSGSAFLRREAIFGLRTLADQPALLVLASLLDFQFPKVLKAEWGWKGAPDFSVYFPETIEMCLEQATGQKLGRNRAAWENWIKENPPKSP